MTKPAIKVKGADQLRKALRQVDSGIKDLKGVHADAAKVVEQRATQIVPRRTGRLEASIRSSGQARQGVVRAGSAGLPYAGVIHFGWAGHNISPQPFLYDALDDRAGEVLDTYERGVEALIRRHGLT
jgi:hypothetical protein